MSNYRISLFHDGRPYSMDIDSAASKVQALSRAISYPMWREVITSKFGERPHEAEELRAYADKIVVEV